MKETQVLTGIIVIGLAAGIVSAQQPDTGSTSAGSTASAPKGVTQPAHIHEGNCAKLDPKRDSPLKGRTAINVHKSTDEIRTYVTCGNIRTGDRK